MRRLVCVVLLVVMSTTGASCWPSWFSYAPRDGGPIVDQGKDHGVTADAVDAGDANDLGCDTTCAGRCVNTQTDPNNCGRCGMACAGGDAAAPCDAGVCGALVCESGWTDCDGNRNNGCEADLRVSMDHCGGCNQACRAGENQTAACDAGMCQPACIAGFGDCDGNAGNGCETNVMTNAAHCGACGTACGTDGVQDGGVSCVAGACQFQCIRSRRNCDDAGANGCEQRVLDDLQNCGGCGIACDPRNGLFRCVDYVCCQATVRAPCGGGAGTCCSDQLECSDAGQCCMKAGQMCSITADCCAGTCQTGRCCVGAEQPCMTNADCCPGAGICQMGRCG